MLDRRHFLQRLGLLSAAAGTLSVPRTARSMPQAYTDNLAIPAPATGNPTRVIVVGAGFAGLTVANALTNANISVTVLEARNRMGGRMDTQMVGGVPVDLGAAWIHGPINNPVAQLATQFGLPFIEADPENDTFSAYDQQLGGPMGGLVSPANFAAGNTVADGFVDPAMLAALRAMNPNGSVQNGIDTYLNSLTLTADQRRFIGFVLRSNFSELDYAGPSAEMSLAQTFNDTSFMGGDQIITGGYTRLVNALASRVRDIRLNEVVSSIAYTGTGVTVTSTSGNQVGSHVVVTVPLGVLKAGSIAFNPGLPASHTTRIAALGVGSLEKVVMRFPVNFWGGNRNSFYYLSDTQGEYPLFVDWSSYVGQPTLVCICGGQFARTLDGFDTATVQTRIMAILTQIFGAAAVAPTSLTVTRWLRDPFALGSYSHIPTGATQMDMDELGQPAGGRVLFAGEATSEDFYGTVHGAMLSGIREAKRLTQQNTVLLPEPMGWLPLAASAASLAWLARRKWKANEASHA